MEVTLKNFRNGEVTKQQVFDFVCRELITQGHASMYVRPDGSDGCAYNAPDGSHCAAGWLMTDLPPSEVAKMEGSSLESLIGGRWDGLHAPPDEDCYQIAGGDWLDMDAIRFVCQLQEAHDEASIDGNFVHRFRRIANGMAVHYGLDASVLAVGAGE